MPLRGRRFDGGSPTTSSPPPLGDGGSGSSGTGGTTLANNATGQGSIKLAKGIVLNSIETDKACRVVFYPTNAAATADKNRKIGTPPHSNTTVLAEFLFSSGGQIITCDPKVVLINGDTPQTSLIYYRITNLSGGTTTILLTMNYTPYI